MGGTNICVFYLDRIRTLVAMATYASHRLIMGKSENCLFLPSCLRYLNFVFAEMFIEYSSTFHETFVLILYFDWLQGPHIGQNFEKHSKIFFSETVKGIKKVQVGKDQEKAQSEKDSHSKNRGGKKPK